MNKRYQCPECGSIATVAQEAYQSDQAFIDQLPVDLPCLSEGCEGRLVRDTSNKFPVTYLQDDKHYVGDFIIEADSILTLVLAGAEFILSPVIGEANQVLSLRMIPITDRELNSGV